MMYVWLKIKQDTLIKKKLKKNKNKFIYNGPNQIKFIFKIIVPNFPDVNGIAFSAKSTFFLSRVQQ
jgi:hypothetical protein